MNIPQILLYNLDSPKGAQMRKLCMPLKLLTRSVPTVSYRLSLAELADGKEPKTPYRGPAFSDEMILLVNCSSAMLDQFLQGFRRHKIPQVPLKAILTPTNSEWDSLMLHDELTKERQAIQMDLAVFRKD